MSTFYSLKNIDVYFQIDPLEQFEIVSNFYLNPSFSSFFFLLDKLSADPTAAWVNSYIYFIHLGIASVLTFFFNLNPIYDSNYFAFKKTTVFFLLALNLILLVKNLIKENLNIKIQIYFLNIFYLFLFIFIANITGLIPLSFTATSSFILAFFLASMHFIGSFFIGIYKWKWKLANLTAPEGAPLIILPFLILIEIISYLARVFSLSIRLFANMMSGHALLKILIGFSYILLKNGFIAISLIPWFIVTAILFLEVLIAFLQAYIFAILVTIYINDVLNLH